MIISNFKQGIKDPIAPSSTKATNPSNPANTKMPPKEPQEAIAISDPLTLYSAYGYVTVKKEDKEKLLVPIFKRIKLTKSTKDVFTQFGTVNVIDYLII